MQTIITELLTFFGANIMPVTVSEFLSWFVTFIVGIEFVLFLFDGIFYCIRSLGRAAR